MRTTAAVAIAGARPVSTGASSSSKSQRSESGFTDLFTQRLASVTVSIVTVALVVIILVS
jgi:hypothetical protein